MSNLICTILVVLLSLGIGGAAGAEGPEAMLERAVALYRSGEFDRSRALLRRMLPLQLPVKLRARSQVYLALNEAAANRISETRRHFAAALRLDPALQVNRDHLKTAVVEVLDELRWKMRGTLVIETNVAGATVVVDGRPVGTAPYRGQHNLGRHRVVVHPPAGRRSAYLAHRAEVVLPAGSTRRLSVRLLALNAAAGREAGGARPADTKDRRRLRPWAWAATAGALATAGTAVGLGFAAFGRRDDADAFARAGDPSSNEDQQQHRELIDASERLATGTNIAWGVAGALAVASAVLFFWDLLASAR